MFGKAYFRVLDSYKVEKEVQILFYCTIRSCRTVNRTCFSSFRLVEHLRSFCCLFTFLDSQKKRRRNSGLVMSKKSRKLLPYNPSEDYIRRLEQMASLATVLTATETQFVNKLTYVPGMAPRSANCASLEREGMQVY